MDDSLREALLGVDCAALADADKSIRVLDTGLRPVRTGLRMLGTARTVRCNDDFLAVVSALDGAAAGEVLVVDTGGSRRAVVGELFSLEAARRELSGIVVDGAIRDTATIATLALPVWARSRCPCSGTTQHPGEIQVPVQCGGVTVRPGDIVFGDDDGVVVLDETEAVTLLPAAQRIVAVERAARARMARGESLLDMLNAREHTAARERGEDSALAFTIDADA